MADVVYLVRDMLFSSKIRETAKHLGLSVQGVPDAAAIGREAAVSRVILLDLRLPAALDAARAAAPTALRIIGFIDHEKVETMDEARAAGCHEVLTKGQFSRDLARLLTAAAAAPSPVV